jgi:hypothetical protein
LSLGPVRLKHAARFPVGDGTQLETPFMMLVTLRGAPPASDRIHSCGLLAPGRRGGPPELVSVDARAETNSIAELSASHRGALGTQASSMSTRAGVLPSVGAVHTEEIRRFCARSTRETTYTTRAPSGEMCGSETSSNEK